MLTCQSPDESLGGADGMVGQAAPAQSWVSVRADIFVSRSEAATHRGLTQAKQNGQCEMFSLELKAALGQITAGTDGALDYRYSFPNGSYKNNL